MAVDRRARPASHIDPQSIAARATVGCGAELLVRHRPPGQVQLAHGQCEHLLMSSVGTPVTGRSVRSVLETVTERREWDSCPTGHITFVPAGFAMRWAWSYASASVHLTLPPSLLSEVAIQINGGDADPVPLKPLFRVMDDRLMGLLHQLREESAEGGPGTDLVSSSLLTQIAVRVFRTAGRDASRTPGPVPRETMGFTAADFRRCVELLCDRLDEKIPLAELAGEFDLSPYHFAREFKRACGFPPHEFQLQLRVDRARKMLAGGSAKSIAEIACELGFSDESHFRRHFRRIVGTTPGRFRSQQ